MRTRWRSERKAASCIGGMALAGVAYYVLVRRWFNRWGTSTEERERRMPGDDLIASPTSGGMQALTINAPPEDIWPWLMQVGYQRGGLYSFDWLDRLFGFLDRPSSNGILPQFQHLAVGDEIPWGHGEHLTVAAVDPPRTLVLEYHGRGMDWVWQFGLYAIDPVNTRLVTRGTEHTPLTLPWRLTMLMMEPAAFVMTTRMLFGLKRRAERLRFAREDDEPGDHRHAVGS